MNRCFKKRNMLSPLLASSLFLDIPHSVQVQHTSVKTKVSGFPYSTSIFDARISWCWYIIAAGHQHMATVSCSLLLPLYRTRGGRTDGQRSESKSPFCPDPHGYVDAWHLEPEVIPLLLLLQKKLLPSTKRASDPRQPKTHNLELINPNPTIDKSCENDGKSVLIVFVHELCRFKELSTRDQVAFQ